MTKILGVPALIISLAFFASAEDRQKEEAPRRTGADRSAPDKQPGRRIRLGGITVGGAYMSGPGWYGYGPSWYGPGYWGPYRAGWWDPFWYGPYLHPGYYSGFHQGPGMGELKLKDAPKEALVFLDGAYAGTVEKLKTIWLEPGIYNLEVKDETGRTWKQRVYVLSGKKLELQPKLEQS